MYNFKKKLISIIAAATVASGISFANCDMQVFNISSAPGTKINEFINQISDECGFTVLIKDKEAKKILNTRLSKINLKDATLDDVLNIILTENNLSYELKDNILKISYLITKTFHVDYVTTKRTGEATTDASVDVGSETAGGGGGTKTRDVNKIESKDEFDFWKNTEEEIFQIINRPGDPYKAPKPVVNPEAGLITVTATLPQIKRVEKYLNKIESRLHNEVMIDVSILAVSFDSSHTKGIDWSQFSIALNGRIDNNNIFTPNAVPMLSYHNTGSGKSFLNLNSDGTASTVFDFAFNLSGLIDFLKKTGDVTILSNPKILTLNNQPALITVGETINYNVPTEITISESGNLGTQSYTPSSIFVGILLNITPEITEDDEIILRINPSVSELKDPSQLQLAQGQRFREIAPDTKEKKISSVVKVKDGSTIILGGLITNTKNLSINGVPILKDIPILGYAFKSEKKIDQSIELVFVIKPKIINTKKRSISLKDLGYNRIK
ncbi:pilus (MSHA type) biogenesis protein MshL [Nitrosophilus kaiyonis]|uniref:pilus (MSHA type) biogenesis protein MshL n=1 Tax=Nitrosophilus kaiyonis TaxID=2930200 RepID=UPI002493BF39|nr:pilus (MSHA type) biogenesis protein MshL [Nitrosophilus kaiyonis]